MYNINKQIIVCIVAALLAFYSIALIAEVTDPTMPQFMQPKRVQPKPRKKKVMPELELTLILISPSRRIAVINDKVVTEGDMIGKVNIVAIADSHVSVKFYKRTHNLFLRAQGEDVSGKTGP